MEVTVLRKEYMGEQDGYRVNKVYTSDGGVSITKTPILSEEEHNRRKQHAIDILSEIECKRMAREMKKAQSAEK